MRDHTPRVDREQMQAFFAQLAEPARWAGLSVTYEEIAAEGRAIAAEMKGYSLKKTLPLLSSLLTLPNYQSNCLRLELLVALAVVLCSGKRKASISDIARWYDQIGRTQCVLGEDPAEDLFVTNIHDETGNHLLQEGLWENAGFYTQLIADVVSTFPRDTDFDYIRRSFQAVLKISNEVCVRAKIQRYTLGNNENQANLRTTKLPRRSDLDKIVKFSSTDLQALDINPQDIILLCSPRIDRDAIFKQSPGHSIFEHQPLIQVGADTFVVAMPTALSVCARNIVIKFITNEDLRDQFDQVLASIYSELLHKTPLLGGRNGAPVHWTIIEATRFASSSSKIDTGTIVSYIFCSPSIIKHAPDGFKSVIHENRAVTKATNRIIRDTIDQCERQEVFKKGLLILVTCGWGKGHAINNIEFDYPNWIFETISVADLVRISWLRGMSPEYFFRMQDGLKAAKETGLEIININGIMNLIAWVRRNNGHIVPHHLFLDVEAKQDRPTFLNFQQNLLRDLRAEADQGRDLHRIPDIEGRWRVVQKVNIDSYFKSPGSENLYASLEDIESGRLLAVLRDTPVVWLAVKADSFIDYGTVFRLWEMAREWLPRVLKEIRGGTLPPSFSKTLLLQLVFEGDGRISDEDDLPDRNALLQLTNIECPGADKKRVNIVFKDGFFQGFRHADNLAERVIVECMIKATLICTGTKFTSAKIQDLLKYIVKNKNARSFHVIYGHDFIQYVAESLPRKLCSLNQTDDAIVKLGLAQKASVKTANNRIEGVEDCCVFLNSVVEGLAIDLCKEISRFRRKHGLLKIYSNIAKAHAEEGDWRRTSAAIIGLHGDNPETLQVYTDQNSKYSAAIVTGRILIEIGVCECPEQSGDLLSDLELTRMMATAAVLYRLGGLSDAIRHHALSAELTVSSFGDILFKDDFGNFVVQPVLAKRMEQRFKKSALKQHENYELPAIIPTVEANFEDEFWDAWIDDFGFDIDQGRHFLTLIENAGIDRGLAVFTVKRSKLTQIMCAEGTAEQAAARFIDTFSLKPRPKWSEPPKGFAHRDIFPWAFRRRLSLVSKPIVQLETDQDPTVIVAPHDLRVGFGYLLSGAYNASLPQTFFRANSLKNKWWGKAGEGHSHTKKVAKHLNSEGWETRSEIAISHVLNKKTQNDPGDIDVLAWSPNSRSIWIIECKDLSDARNHSEMAQLLSEYQGKESNGKPDKLLRHLRRVQLIEDNKDQLAQFCGIQNPIIKSALVCSGIVPMQYAYIEALKGTVVGRIEDLIAKL